MKDPYKPAVWLLVLTGMRPAELCGLRARSGDLIRHVVTISETLLPVSGYGEHHLALVHGPPKLKPAIGASRYRAGSPLSWPNPSPSGPGSGIDPAEPLFVNRVGKPLNRDKFRETVIRPALVAAGLPATTRTYDLRHGHASIAHVRTSPPHTRPVLRSASWHDLR